MPELSEDRRFQKTEDFRSQKISAVRRFQKSEDFRSQKTSKTPPDPTPEERKYRNTVNRKIFQNNSETPPSLKQFKEEENVRQGGGDKRVTVRTW